MHWNETEPLMQLAEFLLLVILCLTCAVHITRLDINANIIGTWHSGPGYCEHFWNENTSFITEVVQYHIIT